MFRNRLCAMVVAALTIFMSLPVFGQHHINIGPGMGRVTTRPSGLPPTIPDLLRKTDLIVIGTLGEPRSYMTKNNRGVLTDFELADPVVVYYRYRQPQPTDANSTPARLVVTQLGGTVDIDGVPFVDRHLALPALTPGRRVLLLLQRSDDKYMIAGRYYGVFGVKDDKVVPLADNRAFATEFRNLDVSKAIGMMMKMLRNEARS